MLRRILGITFLLASRAIALGTPPNTIHNIVSFGDSYTVLDTGDPTRIAWPILLSNYANFTNIFDFAESGATCNQSLTPRQYPAIVQDELPAFFEQLEAGNITSAHDTLYTIWIGTNDVGPNTLLTGGQINNATIVDTTACAVNLVKTLYDSGARNILFLNMIPYELLPLYQIDSYPNKFWTAPRNTTDWNLTIRELAVSGNAISEMMLKFLAPTLQDAHVGYFDSHTLFEDIVNDPGSWLNGTAPFNVTGCVQSCVFALNESLSDPGVCTFVNGTDRDSYVWWNELHPSEQSDRIVARQISNVLQGLGSNYLTWFS